MKLQIALDDISLESAISLLTDIVDYVDIIEIGTPLLLEYGMAAVRAIKKQFTGKEILCDAKIMDGGTLEASAAFRAGADYVTVMGVADTATIKSVVKSAQEWHKSAVVDLLCIDDFSKTLPALKNLDVNMVAVHVGVDQQATGRTPLGDFINIKSLAKDMRVAVAGGINSITIAEYIRYAPDIVVVGGSICNAADPVREAKTIYSQIQGANK